MFNVTLDVILLETSLLLNDRSSFLSRIEEQRGNDILNINVLLRLQSPIKKLGHHFQHTFLSNIKVAYSASLVATLIPYNPLIPSRNPKSRL